MLAPQVNIASRAARQAGKLLRRAAEDVSTLNVEKKGMNDFVTEVDRASEQAIIEILQKVYPDHSILGEETGLIEGKGDGKDWQWVIDPLDGTTNFIHGFPQFCISIALKHKGRVEHGGHRDGHQQRRLPEIHGGAPRPQGCLFPSQAAEGTRRLPGADRHAH